MGVYTVYFLGANFLYPLGYLVFSMASLDQARAEKPERKDKREIIKLSDAAKTVLDSLKSMIIDHVCRNDINREMCERILRRKLSYSVIIEALGVTVQGNELLRLRLASKALELAVGEGAIILSLKEEVERRGKRRGTPHEVLIARKTRKHVSNSWSSQLAVSVGFSASSYSGAYAANT